MPTGRHAGRQVQFAFTAGCKRAGGNPCGGDQPQAGRHACRQAGMQGGRHLWSGRRPSCQSAVPRWGWRCGTARPRPPAVSPDASAARQCCAPSPGSPHAGRSAARGAAGRLLGNAGRPPLQVDTRWAPLVPISHTRSQYPQRTCAYRSSSASRGMRTSAQAAGQRVGVSRGGGSR